jgi:pimeloyl-ACP methyl ester carboxylesterase
LVQSCSDEVWPEALEARSLCLETPCGDGAMAWHVWGDGRPLVLLHGGAGSWRHWVRNIPVFARTRRVLAPDLPGLGRSALPRDATPEGVACVVASGLAQILGAAEYDLVGFSFGANVAGHVAARDDAGIRSLTLVGAAALGTPGGGRMVLETVRNRSGADRAAAHRTNLHRLMIADPARIDALALAIQDWNSNHTRLNSRPFATTATLRDALARGTARRVNAIWGEHDAVAAGDLANRLAAVRTLRPGADVRVIPAAGHWVSFEAADEFNAMLADMLA